MHEFKQRIHTERQRQNGGLIGEAIKWREDYLKASNQRPPPDTNDPRDERQSDREIIKDMISDEAHQLADGGDEEDASLFFEIATGHGTLVSDARDRWLREEGENYREQTVRQHRRAFEVFLKWAGPMTLTSTVDRKKAGEFILQHLVETSGLKPKTINRYISHLSSGWEWMIRRGLVEDNVWLRQSVRVGKSTDERGAMT
ncbi:MAG: hypothetical protein MI824_19090 [Hyphomicrobiales bacterium]|nr:hypothetical protein [Hyphomicrobiales bacterium]